MGKPNISSLVVNKMIATFILFVRDSWGVAEAQTGTFVMGAKTHVSHNKCFKENCNPALEAQSQDQRGAPLRCSQR